MEKIKIAVLLHGLSGGAGQVVINYFSHMNNRNDYEVDVITLYVESEKLKSKYENNGMNIIQIPSKKESILKNMTAMYHLFKSKKYDIVYGHMTLTNCFPFFVAKLCRINVRISHSHLVTSPTIINAFLAKATQLLSTEYLSCGIDAGKALYGDKNFKVFNNAIDLEKFKYNEKKRKEQRRLLGITDDTLVVGNIGRFVFQKNHEQLIDIFEAITMKEKDSKLLLVGDGPLFEEIKKKVHIHNLESYVIFVGAVNNVCDFIQAMDVFVLPSLYEGLCLSAIEVQGCGIPCVFSDKVSFETKKLENISFIELEESSEKWAEEILHMWKVSREKESGKILRTCGYDIDVEAQKLDMCIKNNLKKNRY